MSGTTELQRKGVMTSRTQVEKAAEDLLRTTWITEGGDVGDCPLPVDPFHIAERLGLRVYTQVLGADVSGMLAKRPGRDPEVYINADDSLNRQRFSCAHEIGHYSKRVTGRDDDSWGYIDRRGPSSSEGTDPEEIYANQFAAALLMPEHKVRELHKDLGPAAMAVAFGVSVGAMKFRLDNLGLS
jgi:Zn-dependent peptidase ImmA (M78 family)